METPSTSSANTRETGRDDRLEQEPTIGNMLNNIMEGEWLWDDMRRIASHIRSLLAYRRAKERAEKEGVPFE